MTTRCETCGAALDPAIAPGALAWCDDGVRSAILDDPEPLDGDDTRDLSPDEEAELIAELCVEAALEHEAEAALARQPAPEPFGGGFPF